MKNPFVTPARQGSEQLLATARYIRDLEAADRMKIQKLLYYVQGSYLVQTGRPLFPEEPQAWRFGPVYVPVYVSDKHSTGAVDEADESVLTGPQKELIRAVVERYRGYRPVDMMSLTHKAGPWTQARGDLPKEADSKEPITHQSMMRFFSTSDETTIVPAVSQEARWDEASDARMEDEENRWAGLLARLAS
ncbi:Panacea domain-containing protein [Actinomyces faecalis]|uniref:Panacea domain-containing protein n=1 Tax=Actinomyces faecalis TaxID=2722820 RepID=UPI0015552FCE|nr:type II toxin-antitoxin system antitoxin SocA domain-containing protein [Actinomyces faecalis]